MNILHDISPKEISSEKFTAVIEIPKGSKVKYELDKATGMLRMDRILYTSTHYPANYGFIPRTHADDGDPLDVLVLCSETLEPMSLVRCYPIGVISMMDNGAADEKIICIPTADPSYNTYTDISELPKHIFEEMSHFFSVHKHRRDRMQLADQRHGHAVKAVARAEEMSHFFSVYKQLEHKDTVIDDVKGKEEAKNIIEACIGNYIEKFCK